QVRTAVSFCHPERMRGTSHGMLDAFRKKLRRKAACEILRCAQDDSQLERASVQTPRCVGVQMNLCICSWKRTGSLSAKIHSTISRGSIRPKIGENKTARQRFDKL